MVSSDLTFEHLIKSILSNKLQKTNNILQIFEFVDTNRKTASSYNKISEFDLFINEVLISPILYSPNIKNCSLSICEKEHNFNLKLNKNLYLQGFNISKHQNNDNYQGVYLQHKKSKIDSIDKFKYVLNDLLQQICAAFNIKHDSQKMYLMTIEIIY